jgi:hypothetical protein
LRAQDAPSPDLKSRRSIAVIHGWCGHTGEAIDILNSILAIDPDFTFAHYDLARLYAKDDTESQKPDWEKAISYQNTFIQHLKSSEQPGSQANQKQFLNDCLMDKAAWLRKLERHVEARDIYTTMLQDDFDDNEVRLQYIYTLCETQSYGEVVETLDQLNQTDEKTKKNLLTHFIHSNADNADYHNIISRAFKQVDGIHQIQAYYEIAIAEANRDETKRNSAMQVAAYVLTYHLATILWTYGEGLVEKEKAIKLWEQLTDPKKKVEPYTQMFQTQTLASRRLAGIYLAKAVEVGHDSKVAAEMLAKVRAFALAPKGERLDDEDQYGIGMSPIQVRSLLGRYHTKVGKIQEARKLLRIDVDVGLKLLSDEDPENDFQGYRKLGDAFMDFGDDINATAAWSLIQPTRGLAEYRDAIKLIDASDNPAQSQDHDNPASNPEEVTDTSSTAYKHLLEGPLYYTCDGRCGKDWTYADEFNVCRECVDIQFCVPCLEKVQKGELTRDVCNKNHTFLHIPAWGLETLERGEAGKVLVGDRVLDVKKEWLEGIKREWGLLAAEAEEVNLAVGASA